MRLDTDNLLDMMASRHKYFRWTKRTVGIAFAYMVAFPAFIGYFAYTTDVCIPARCSRMAANPSCLKGQMGYERKEERKPYLRVLDECRETGVMARRVDSNLALYGTYRSIKKQFHYSWISPTICVS